MAECTYNLPKIYRSEKKFFKSGHIFRKDAKNKDQNSKNKDQKINFSFDSALCVSIVKIGAKLRGGVCITLVGKSPNGLSMERAFCSKKHVQKELNLCKYT